MRKLVLFFCLLLSASSYSFSSAQEDSLSKWREEDPLSILIMPPINETNNVPAKEYLYSSLALPLINRGYYVFSPIMSMELLQEEGAYNSEIFLDGDISKFRDVFGADVLLFTIIHTWGKVLYTISTDIEYRFVSAKTGDVLLSHTASVSVDLSPDEYKDDDNPWVWLGGLIASSVSAASTPIVTVAREANSEILKKIPYGRYNPNYTPKVQGEELDNETAEDAAIKTIEETSKQATEEVTSEVSEEIDD